MPFFWPGVRLAQGPVPAVEAKCDVWSLGCCLYALLCTRPRRLRDSPEETSKPEDGRDRSGECNENGWEVAQMDTNGGFKRDVRQVGAEAEDAYNTSSC